MLTIIVKGTNGCNLACSYCSLGKKNHAQLADRGRLYDLMKYSCELCIRQSEQELCFIFHGGEPTLIPCRDYDAAIQKIKRFRS